jgi:hypothetical protein
MARIACALAAMICSVPIGTSAVSAAVTADGDSTRGASPLAAAVGRTSTANESSAQIAAASPLMELFPRVDVTPRLASETIPAGSRILRISVHGSLKDEQPKQRVLHVTSAKKIDEVVALLNALPASQPGLRRCPIDFGIRVRLAFYTSRASPPLAVADVDPQGCGNVELTIRGRPQPALEGGSLLIQQIDHVLGVKLNTTPPRLPSTRPAQCCASVRRGWISSNYHYIPSSTNPKFIAILRRI